MRVGSFPVNTCVSWGIQSLADDLIHFIQQMEILSVKNDKKSVIRDVQVVSQEGRWLDGAKRRVAIGKSSFVLGSPFPFPFVRYAPRSQNTGRPHVRRKAHTK